MPWISAGSAQILAVHAALLHTGKIVLFSGDEHDHDLHLAGVVDHTRLFDCSTFAVTTLPSPPSDLFCCGHALLTDGRLLTAGGTEHWGGGDAHGAHGAAGHFSGLRDAHIFNPPTNSWTRVADLLPEPGKTTGGGRWYPTLVTLSDGRVLAMAGHPRDDDTRHNNRSLEAFTTAPTPLGAWTQIGVDNIYNDTMYYPRLFVVPGGQVFCANPSQGRTRSLNSISGTWTDLAPPAPNTGATFIYHDIAGTAVLLPLLPIDGYRARVLVCNDTDPYIFDITNPGMGWIATAPRAVAGSPRRRNGCATLLPTGEVFVSGGAPNPSSDAGGLMPAELYTPGLDSWAALETPSFVRNYHSVALLMPDGRVWVAGSNIDCKQSFDPPGVDNRRLEIEVYEPWYHGRPDRPVIVTAPGSVDYNTQFDVETPQAATVARVALVRCGSSTHAFNPDQRYVSCTFTRGTGKITVTSPPDGAIAPPGYYLLFLIGPGNVPSLGRFIRLPRIRPKLLKEFKREVKEIIKIETKELLKDVLKDKREVKEFKEILGDKHIKEFKEKDKDLVEGMPFEDPVVLQALEQIAQKVQALEDQIQEKGAPFIRHHERPEVGARAVEAEAEAAGPSDEGRPHRPASPGTGGKGPTAEQGHAAAFGGPVGEPLGEEPGEPHGQSPVHRRHPGEGGKPKDKPGKKSARGRSRR